MYNLLEEKWIPVIRASGKKDMLAPYQISDSIDAPVSLDFYRADFNSSVLQFLIVLMQTYYPPHDEDEWLDRLEEPPSESEIKEVLKGAEDAFQLYGTSHNFMQDSSLADSKKKRTIDHLLITTPGDNALNHNSDLFIKRADDGFCLCRSCAAAALFTMQTFANMGGAGIRSSVRGSSPLNTITIGNTLWQSVYLNVLTSNRIARTGGDDVCANPFSWMRDEMSTSILSAGSNPCEIAWATVRRIYLDEPVEDQCSICGCKSDCFHTFNEEKHGNTYDGWVHPLGPTRIKDSEFIPALAVRDTLCLNNWVSLVYPVKGHTIPALCIKQVTDESDNLERVIGKSMMLDVTGYHCSNAKPLMWIDSKFPVPLMGAVDSARFVSHIQNLILMSELILNKTVNELKKLNSAGLIPGYNEERFRDDYWIGIEPRFLEILITVPESSQEDLLQSWFDVNRKLALDNFDSSIESTDLEHYPDVLKHRSNLIRYISWKAVMRELEK